MFSRQRVILKIITTLSLYLLNLNTYFISLYVLLQGEGREEFYDVLSRLFKNVWKVEQNSFTIVLLQSFINIVILALNGKVVQFGRSNLDFEIPHLAKSKTLKRMIFPDFKYWLRVCDATRVSVCLSVDTQPEEKCQ